MNGGASTAAPVPDGRTRHYSAFYGLTKLRDDAPVAVTHGNCQASALQVLLDRPDLQTVRIPPVFELTATDLPFLERLLRRTDVLITHPVRDGYADLPLGSRELGGWLPPGSVTVTVPAVYWVGLHPFAAIIRDPADRSREPPGVPYHDLRTVTAAAGRAVSSDQPEHVLRAIGAASLVELRHRETAGCDVRISDVFEQPQPGDMLTINHPGNRVLIALATRLRAVLGLAPAVRDPGRTLLGDVVAPVPPSVLSALGLAHAGPAAQDHWSVHGRSISSAEVEDQQLNWYRQHPAVVAEGLRRYAPTLDLLGWR